MVEGERTGSGARRGAKANQVISVLAGLLAAMVAGCADRAAPGAGVGLPPAGLGARGGTPNLPSVFVSPAGKAFRAGPHEPYPSVLWFAAADADGNGALTSVEFEQDATGFFRELDVDGDGRLGPREIERYEAEITPEVSMAGSRPPIGLGGGMPGPMGPGGGPPGGRPGPGGPPRAMRYGEMPMGAGMFGLLNIPEPVTAADLDISGSVTLDEFRRAARQRFALLDADRDGRLTLQELPQTPFQRIRGGRGPKRPRAAAR